MQPSVTTGILFGIAAAFSQSLSYIFSRLYVIRHPSAPGRLLVSSHLLISALLVHRGLHLLDDRMSRRQLFRRVAVAALMTVAIILYVLDS